MVVFVAGCEGGRMVGRVEGVSGTYIKEGPRE